MKKLAAISLVLAMTAASLAGCGSTANTAAPAESEAAETPAATTEETTDTAADTEAADGKVYNIVSWYSTKRWMQQPRAFRMH